MNKYMIIILCRSYDKINVLLTIYWDNDMFDNPNFPIIII
jgi:hypothetical protein